MVRHRVKVFAPATISNLGSGFDVLGLAIDQPGDYVVAERTRESGLSFSVKTNVKDIPTQPHENVAAHVAQLMLDELAPPFGFRMILQKRMPIGSGLGSSGASSVASVVAVNALLPKPLKKHDLLRFAVEGERKASGSPHADNVAPSLLGGVVLARSYSPLDVVALPIKDSVVWVVVHPHLVVRTEDARNVLPKTIRLKDAIQQWGNVSGVTAGLITGDAALVGKCVEDVIVEPVRASLVKGFYDVKQAAMNAGALGCSFSGSGPSMFAVTNSLKIARRVGKAMRETFRNVTNASSDVYISRVNMRGAMIVK
jgi:homoserine kinase